ncbi:hypothetical protein Poli38472_006696 [Pythium oligandrum]|uniref:Calcium-activated potassium channel subunit alpha-1 n=1 Tax=Pythium oligandrum TaxID=41045 RepID=A0A8K1FC13_PYTOL|nr:hypothetical protein Poli38472_006696 [Pythium oligandrum]|eukprot:TMW56686.1 hypothetical protein Poli38472_006696 [Pythium oligandrum]
MGWFCVNQYELQINGGAGETSTPRCIAHWAHTQEQVLIALCIWGFVLLIAASWTVISRRQRRHLKADEIGFSLKYRRWARTSRTAAIINRPVQMITSLGIFFAMIDRCSSYEVSAAAYYCMTAFYVVALVDAGVRFLAARYKVLYCFAPLTILEILMIASHAQIGLGSTKMINGVPTRAWLDFSIMRPIFILRSYSEMEKHVPRSSRGWMMVRLAIKLLLLIMFGASAMFFFETLGEMPFFQQNGFAHLYSCEDGSVTRDSGECDSETWSIMFSFYFTVVTLGTVGYGDNSPKTVLSRLLAIMFIVMGVILFSLEIENLINLYKSRQIGNPSYQPKPESRHVIIMGNPSFTQLLSILRELFHEDHTSSDDTGQLHAVVLGDRKSRFTKGLVAKLEADPIFVARVTYVAGNPTRTEDLERALAKQAEAVFVFPDKLSDDPANEDALNIMRVLATRRYCGPDVRCLVMILRAESARHMLAAGVQRDDIICENVIKMGTLAQSAVSHGASTLLANLAASLSVDSNSTESTTGFATAFKGKAGGTDVRFSTLTVDDASVQSRMRNWRKEYYTGLGKEMYLIRLSKQFAGLTFAEAASRIFDRTAGNVVLIAVEVVFSGNEDVQGTPQATESRVLLNPGISLIMAEWMQCYVIADDLAHVFTHNICHSEDMHEGNRYTGASPTVMNAFADTFVEQTPKAIEGEVDGPDCTLGTVTAYASLGTPHMTKPIGGDSSARFIQHRREDRNTHGTEWVVLDRSLHEVALHFHDTSNAATYLNSSMAGAAFTRPASNSISSDGPRTLEPPPLSVLVNPEHIVVCSFLGEESLASLLWFLLPLRSVFSHSHPPITILDDAEPSPTFSTTLSAFNDVYYVRGSPLVYSDLQRAGAKAAAAVIVLGKQANTGLLQASSDGDVDSSIIDGEAIFATMLIELKMDLTKIFTITELTDESNSKFLGTSFQLQYLSHDAVMLANQEKDEDGDDLDQSDSLSWWEYLLLNDIPQQKSEKAIYGLPLYMSGRLLHPELCENMLVQAFYNPSIHKIIRQLVGGLRCTGVIRTYRVPKNMRDGHTYQDIFHALASSSYSGICIGVYRLSTQIMRSGRPVEMRVVLTTPDPDFEIRFYHRFWKADNGELAKPPTQEPHSYNSTKPSFLDPHARISRYLAPKSRSGLDILRVPKSQRRSFIAQEDSSSFHSYYV